MYVNILNVPVNYEYVNMRITIGCSGVFTLYSGHLMYPRKCRFGWTDQQLLLAELQQFNKKQITMTVSIRLTYFERIIRVDRSAIHSLCPITVRRGSFKTIIKWVIDQNMMDKFQNARKGQRFESSINKNPLFIMQFFPADSELYLWYSAGKRLDLIPIRYTLSCSEAGLEPVTQTDTISGARVFCLRHFNFSFHNPKVESLTIIA
eukprot:317365_1